MAQRESVHPGIIQVSLSMSVVAALLRTQELLYPGSQLATFAFALSVASTIMLLISYVFQVTFAGTDTYTLGRFVRYTRQVGLLALLLGVLSLYGAVPFWLY